MDNLAPPPTHQQFIRSVHCLLFVFVHPFRYSFHSLVSFVILSQSFEGRGNIRFSSHLFPQPNISTNIWLIVVCSVRWIHVVTRYVPFIYRLRTVRHQASNHGKSCFLTTIFVEINSVLFDAIVFFLLFFASFLSIYCFRIYVNSSAIFVRHWFRTQYEIVCLLNDIFTVNFEHLNKPWFST